MNPQAKVAVSVSDGEQHMRGIVATQIANQVNLQMNDIIMVALGAGPHAPSVILTSAAGEEVNVPHSGCQRQVGALSYTAGHCGPAAIRTTYPNWQSC